MQTDLVPATLRSTSYNEPSPPIFDELAEGGYIDYAAWLADDVLLLVGWFHLADESKLEVFLMRDDTPHPVNACMLSYYRENLPLDDVDPGKVLLLHFEQPTQTRPALGRLVISNGEIAFALNPLELAECVTDLHTLVRNSLAGLDPDTRTAIVTSIATNAKTAGPSLRLSRSLFALREALRERMSYAVTVQEVPQGLCVDMIVAIEARSVYIRGWLRDAEAQITALTAVSPEGSRIALLERLFFYPRPDVAQFYGAMSRDELMAPLGFIGHFTLDTPSYLSTGWTLEMRNEMGTAVEISAPEVVQGNMAARTAILESLPHQILPNESLMRDHVFPAMERLQQARAQSLSVESIIQFGMPPATPEVSIIVPLYKRMDFVEQQMAQFAQDPEMRQADLIYVLDSPEQAAFLRDTAAQLFLLYGLPFRVVICKSNGGFSAANNTGIRYARGSRLLLLNSDILPDKPGWLGEMTRFYDATPGIGALGPKLLYEDDSLQHAGMYFYRPAGTLLANLWQNLHYFKGLHRDVAAANVARPVPAVTGACLMIDRNLYHEVGGLQDTYLQGDHEDSDLCLRLIEAGRENWYFPDAELYHLEAQSYDNSTRGLTALYNRWLHTHLWGARIEEVMGRYAL